MVNKKVMVKRETLVTYRMLGAGIMPSYIEFLKADYVFLGKYSNVVVWKDLGHSSILGDKIPMNGTPPKSNGEVRTPSTAKRPQTTCLSYVTQTQKCLYESYTQKERFL